MLVSYTRLSLIVIAVAAGFPTVVAAQNELPTPGGNPAAAQSAPTQTNDPRLRQHISYALGLNIGSDLRADQVDIDLESILQGLRDGFEGNRPKLSEEQRTAVLEVFQRQMQAKLRAQHEQLARKNKQQADAFLQQNRQRQGVTETASGLQYEVLATGNGASPTRSDRVAVHYRGTLLDGTEFDSSYRTGEPARFQVGGVIPGWIEALQKMKVGDKWRLFLPPELAYGANPPGPPIEPNSLLVFEVELLGVE